MSNPIDAQAKARIARGRRRMNHADLIVARIERARQDRGISVAELARRMGVDRKRLWYVQMCIRDRSGRLRFPPSWCASSFLWASSVAF